MRDHRGAQLGEGRDLVCDLDVGVADALEVGRRDLGEVAVHLFVEHELFAPLRPDAPRVVIDDVGDDERAAVGGRGETAELDLEVDEQRVATAPGVREYFVGDAGEFGHNAELLRRREAAAHDLVGLDERVVVGVVLEEELDHPRDDDGAARDAGHALDERAGGDAADDDFERDHRRAPDAHLVVVVVFAAAR